MTVVLYTLAAIAALVALAIVVFVLWLAFHAVRGVVQWWRDRHIPPLAGQRWRQGFRLLRITAVSGGTVHLIQEPQELAGRPAPLRGPRTWSEPAEHFRRRPGLILESGPRSSPHLN